MGGACALDHDADCKESYHDLISLIEHDLFGKPVSTFPDHALMGLLGMPVTGHALTFRIRIVQYFDRTGYPASELDHGAQAKNPGIVGLDAGGIEPASAGIDHILGIEFEIQPAGRLPAVPDFERNFVTAGIQAEGGRIHVGRTDREADFVLGAPGEGSGVLELHGDLVVLERSPVIGDGRIEIEIPTLRGATFIGQALQDRLIKAVAAALISQILAWDATEARNGRNDTRQ